MVLRIGPFHGLPGQVPTLLVLKGGLVGGVRQHAVFLAVDRAISAFVHALLGAGSGWQRVLDWLTHAEVGAAAWADHARGAAVRVPLADLLSNSVVSSTSLTINAHVFGAIWRLAIRNRDGVYVGFARAHRTSIQVLALALSLRLLQKVLLEFLVSELLLVLVAREDALC